VAVSSEELWRNHLEKARWFQGKGLPFHRMTITPLAWVVDSGDVWVRSELASVRVGDTTQTYHLLVGYLSPGHGEPEALVGQMELDGRGLVDVVDVPRSGVAMTALLTALSTSMTWLDTPPDPDSPTRIFEGEQSNTTVLVGDSVLFKIFRKLAPGPNLECEIMSALTGSRIVPSLIGILSTPGRGYDLGIFCERILHARDGWAYCVDSCAAHAPIADQMRDLGETLRTLHTQLAQVFGGATIDSSIVSRQMLDRLDSACEHVPELATMRPALCSILTLPPGDVQIQRIHGDFHLGQALISPLERGEEHCSARSGAPQPGHGSSPRSLGWTIIDFEGEPLKSPAERAAPDSVWRDVAGLTRSLDYARSTHPDSRSHQAEDWYRQARAGFLAGYLDQDPEALPGRLLTAYEVDKAVYEMVYELRNRPTWAGIPRHALKAAIAGAESD